MEGQPRNRRRIDRVTATDFLDGIEERSSAQVREMRDECRIEEDRLSYTRRLLQGRLDIARAEQARRRGDGGTDLIGSLTQILADSPGSRRAPTSEFVRTPEVYTPAEAASRRREDSAVDDATLGRLPDLSDEELAKVIARLEAEERQVSDQRHQVIAHLDALQAALVRRYREGSAGVDEIVVSPPPGH